MNLPFDLDSHLFVGNILKDIMFLLDHCNKSSILHKLDIVSFTIISAIVIRILTLINEFIMLQRKKIKSFLDTYISCCVLFHFVVRKWDYPWIDIIKQILTVSFVLSFLLLLYATWQETHSLREVFRENMWYIITLLVVLVLVILYLFII